MVSAFEGNKAKTTTMLPVIQAFMTARQLPGVTVAAGAGMIWKASPKQIETAGLPLILAMTIPHVACVVTQWRREHLGDDIPDGHIVTQPWPAGPATKRGDQVTCYQDRADRARRALRGTGEQASTAEKPSPARPRPRATGSSSCPAAPRASTASGKPRPAPSQA